MKSSIFRTLAIIAFYLGIYGVIIWFWNGALEETKASMFYIALTIGCIQSAYYGYKVHILEAKLAEYEAKG